MKSLESRRGQVAISRVRMPNASPGNPPSDHEPPRGVRSARPLAPGPGLAAIALGCFLAFTAWMQRRDIAAAPHPAASATAPSAGASVALPDYDAWAAACRRLPYNRQLNGRLPSRDLLPLRSYAEFAAVLEPALSLFQTGALAQARAWLNASQPSAGFYDLNAGYYLQNSAPFQPYAERHELPPGARVFIHGDLHGDIHSLIAFLDSLRADGHLEGFSLTGEETRLLFLGDYTDRGSYGIEVLYTLLRLKLANPDRVLLVRGNHEDVDLIARYGFLAEAFGKYGRSFDARRVARLYDFLPVVLYLSCEGNVAQCNHGGLEPGFDPNPLLGAPPEVSFQQLGTLRQTRFLQQNEAWVKALPERQQRELRRALLDFAPATPTTPTVLGFMWNDFTLRAGEPQFAVDPDRAFVHGDQLTRRVLESARGENHAVRVIFRAHQHAAALNPMMARLIASRGVFRHWQTSDPGSENLRPNVESSVDRAIPEGSVWTFNVSPDSAYGAGCGFGFAAAGELVTASRWEDWSLRVRNVSVVPDP
jgi:hypothetical protein